MIATRYTLKAYKYITFKDASILKGLVERWIVYDKNQFYITSSCFDCKIVSLDEFVEIVDAKVNTRAIHLEIELC